jgi:putative transcriptional regulator
MDKSLFDDLTQSLKEAAAIRKGTAAPSRRFEMEQTDVKAVREGIGLSQNEFARLMRVSVKTLQNWEQHRRYPTGPAVALLKIVSAAPKTVLEALHG